jgi:hypothetical protein
VHLDRLTALDPLVIYKIDRHPSSIAPLEGQRESTTVALGKCSVDLGLQVAGPSRRPANEGNRRPGLVKRIKDSMQFGFENLGAPSTPRGPDIVVKKRSIRRAASDVYCDALPCH